MKTLYSKTTAIVLFMAGLLSQNVSAQCAVTTGPTNDCSYGDAIDNFSIGTISVTNSGCSSGSGYSAFASPIFNLDTDVSYTLTAAVGGNVYDQGLAVWIDINNDGLFDSSELIYASAIADLSHTGTVNIPSSFPGIALNTPLAMRVMCAYNTVLTGADACTSNISSYGETEDYIAILTASVPPSNIEATAVFEPFDSDCGVLSDTVKVTVSNLTATDEVDVPVELNLTGAVTGTYYDTIPSLLGNTSMDLNMAVINTQAGGTLNAQLVVDFSDDDSSDDTLDVTINILDATDLLITGDSVVCEGDSLDLAISNPTGAEVYTWYIDGSSINTGTNFNTGAVLASSQVTVESSNGCRSNDTLDVTVTPLPVLSFTSSVNVGTVDFTGTVANEDSVSWNFGDGNTGSGTTPQHAYTANGTYTVCFTAYSSCGSVDYCDSVVVSTIGVDELFLGGNVEVYPNPTADEVNISFNASDAFTGKWAVYDIDGKLLESKNVDGVSSLSVSLGQYPAGTYILKMTSDAGETFRKELLKQ